MAKPYYKNFEDKCIAAIILLPASFEQSFHHAHRGFMLYVAWEWENAAHKGYFKFYKSRFSLPVFDYNLFSQQVNNVCNNGEKMTEGEIREIFPEYLHPEKGGNNETY